MEKIIITYALITLETELHLLHQQVKIIRTELAEDKITVEKASDRLTNVRGLMRNRLCEF